MGQEGQISICPSLKALWYASATTGLCRLSSGVYPLGIVWANPLEKTMTFTTDVFQHFKAIANFNFGPLNGITISEGVEMEFDGTTLKMEGQVYVCPAFSLAIKAKFVVPIEDSTTTYAPPESKVEVKAASGRGEKRVAVQMGTAVEEEQVVGSVARTNNRRASGVVPTQNVPQDAPSGRRVLSVEEADALNAAALAAELDKPVVKGFVGGNRMDRLEEEAPTRSAGGKYKVQQTDGASQGVVVGAVRSSQLSAHVGAEGEATRQKPFDLTRVTPDMVEQSLRPQKVTEGIAGLEAKTAATQTGIRNLGVQVMASVDGIRENPPKPMRTTTVVTEGEDIRNLGGFSGDVRIARGTDNESVADLLPDALVAAPPSKARVAVSTPDSEIAEIVANWSLKRQWTKRVQEALNFYADWPEALEAIYAIESEAVVKHIKSGLAKLAAGG